MICPQCGYEMGNKNKCLRCGYEVKTLSVVVEKDEPKQEREDVKVIDPCNVFLTHPYGYEDDFGTGFGSAFDDPFVSLIDSLFGDPIGDLLGGLFGFETVHNAPPPQNDPPQPKRKKQGPVVVVDDIEIIEPDGTSKKSKPKTEQKTEQSEPQKKSDGKIKNMFKRNNNKK